MEQNRRKKTEQNRKENDIRPKNKKRNIFELDDGTAELKTKRTVSTKGTGPSQTDLAERDYRLRVTNRIGQARRLSRTAVTAIITSVIVIAVLLGVIRMIFSVSHITVTGNEHYSEFEISEVCGVDYGDFILFFDTDSAEQKIMRACPYVSDVSVERELPSSINIRVVESEPEYYITLYSEYVLLSKTLRVIGSVSEQAEAPSLIKLELTGVTRALEGEALVLSGQGDYEKICDIIEATDILDGENKVVCIDFTDRHNATVLCEGDYLIKLGEWNDAKVKLEVARRVLGDSLVKDANGAEIDVSYPKEASVKPK